MAASYHDTHPRHLEANRIAQAASWTAKHEERRLAICRGYVRSFLIEYPDRLPDVITAAAEAVQPKSEQSGAGSP